MMGVVSRGRSERRICRLDASVVRPSAAPRPSRSAPTDHVPPPERSGLPAPAGGRGVVAVALALAVLLALLPGCGERSTIAGDTPQQTAAGFVEAMQAADYAMAATGFDYATNARRQNPDWDNFGEHQRNLIVEKLRGDRADQLRSLAGMFASGEASVGDVQQRDSSASATINAGANTLVLQMRQIEDQWLIASVVEDTGG